MKYLLFNWDTVKEEVAIPTEISNEKFEQLAKDDPNGFVITDTDDFVSRFNSMHFSTETHQLRIVK